MYDEPMVMAVAAALAAVLSLILLGWAVQGRPAALPPAPQTQIGGARW